jgi:hypothetical protein
VCQLKALFQSRPDCLNIGEFCVYRHANLRHTNSLQPIHHKLSVENRFIDYFKENTEINQGLTLIDKKLGGTIPLEIVFEGSIEYLMVANSVFIWRCISESVKPMFLIVKSSIDTSNYSNPILLFLMQDKTYFN